MYAVTGITGKVGGAAAKALLEAGHKVRAIVRDEEKGRPWAERGCEVAIASAGDVPALTRAFAGVEGVFLMNPPNYDPAPGFPGTVALNEANIAALTAAKPGRVVFLSTVGGHVERFSLLNNSHMTENALRSLSIPVAFVRAGWFMENAAWDVPAARGGVIPSFLQPLDHPIPMVASADIGRTVAKVLCEEWQRLRVVELEGPRRYSASDIAKAFSSVLGRPVRSETVPRDTWESLFRSQGMKHPEPRIQMLDGFNAGWIDFEGTPQDVLRGTTPLETVIQELVRRAQ